MMSPSVTSPRLRFLSKTTFTFLILVAATALLATGKIALGGIGSDVDVGVSKSALDSEANESDVTAFTIVVTNSGPGDATGVEITDLLPAGLSPITGLQHVADNDTILLWQFAETNLLDTTEGGFDDAEDSGPNDFDGRAFDDGLDRTPQTVEANVAGIEGGSGIEFFFHAQPALKQFERATMLSPDVPDSIWGDGDFTVEMWVTDISNAELAGTDPDFGRFLAAQGKWQWALSITTNGAFKVRTGSTFDTDPLTWDANTWYYVALVADTSGAGAGQALYSVYRAAMGSPLALIGSGVLDDIPNADDENFHFGSGTSPGLPSRILDFVADELHYSRVARSEGYLRALSGTTATAGGFDSGTGVWTLGGLLNGGTATLELGASVDGGTEGTSITNLASVTAVNENDTNPGNDQSEASIRVPGADLAVIKTVDNQTPSVGDSIVFTVTVTNSGPDTATRIKVQDALPPGISPFNVADANTLLHWHFAETAAPPDFPDTTDSGPLGLDGWIYNDGIDRTPGTVTLDAGGLAGSGVEFQGFANDGSSASRATVVSFDLPTSEFPGGDFTAELWATGISDSELDSRADGTFGMYLIGQGRLGEDWALSLEFDGRFQLRFNRADSGGGEQVVTFGNAGVDWDNDTWYYIALVADTAGQAAGMAEYRVYRRTGTGEAGFEVIGTAVRPEVVSDEEEFYVSSSTSPGALARVLDFTCDEVHFSKVARSQATLEANSVLRVGASQGTYEDGGIWDIGDLGAGASVSLVITARVESAGVVTNTADIIAVDQGDPDAGNNSGSVVTGPRADLGVTKTVDNASPSAGDTIVYTVTVNNSGPDTATGIQVEDALPAGVSAFQLADSDTLVHWHFSEPAAPPDFPDTVDSGPLGLDGWIYNDGIDRTPGTVTLDAGGLAGSGVEFQGFASASRATVVSFDLPTSEFPGGDFTAELWATGISDSELDSRADGTFGMYLIGQGRLGEDWALSLEFDGRFQLRFNRADSGGGEQVVTFGNAGVDWDNDTWYYIALVADTAGQAAGMAEYRVYRRTGTGEAGFEVIGTAVRPEVVSDEEEFYAGTSTQPGAVARVLDFTCDEVHYSKVARSQSYLESNSVLRVGASQGTYEDGGIWDVGTLASGASATLVITARVETVASAITNRAEIIGSDAIDSNPNNDSDSAVIGGPPPLPDTDGDGIPDFWELLHFGGITNAVADEDTDMDMADNLAEYTADTIPTNAASVFVITDLTVSNPTVISFDSSAGRVYTLQSATDLVTGNWSNEPGQVDRTGVGGPDSFTDDTDKVEKEYRIGVRVP